MSTEEDRERMRVPLFCPICDIVMKGDNKTYYKWGCCRHCHIEFVEDREERWESGWRPNQEDLDRFMKIMNY